MSSNQPTKKMGVSLVVDLLHCLKTNSALFWLKMKTTQLMILFKVWECCEKKRSWWWCLNVYQLGEETLEVKWYFRLKLRKKKKEGQFWQERCRLNLWASFAYKFDI
jgi:hypothetical protein